MPAKKLQVFNSPQEMQKWSLAQRRRGKPSALSHHRRLAERSFVTDASRSCGKPCGGFEYFVNPMQFGPKEDLDNYPNRLRQISGVSKRWAWMPFSCPTLPSCTRRLSNQSGGGPLADRWCGASRPGHFDGVLTVVAKLFNLVSPDKAYFGEKTTNTC